MRKTKTQPLVSQSAIIGCLLENGNKVFAELEALGFRAYLTDATHRAVYDAAAAIAGDKVPLDTYRITKQAGLSNDMASTLVVNACEVNQIERLVLPLREAAAIEQAHKLLDSQTNALDDKAVRLAELLRPFAGVTTSTGAVKASEWLTEPDEPEQPIITGLFDAGDRVAIVGQSKARKSFYALQLAAAVATGTEFLGVAVVKQAVLLVNGEIVARSYKKRLRRMAERLGIDPASLAGLVIRNASEDADASGFAEILALAKKHGVTVVVIDPAYLLLGDEIEQQQVKQSVRDMKRFSVEGLTLVLVYHATKGKIGDRQAIDRISGSGIFARDASTMLTLCEHATEPDHVVIQAITRNHAPQAPATVRFDEGAFILTDVAPLEKTSATKEVRLIPSEDVADCFNSVKVNYADAVKAVQLRLGVGIGKAKDLLAKAVSDGLIQTMKEWRSTLYYKGEAS
ncbi:MAG: AAA family ATPase [bacterium]